MRTTGIIMGLAVTLSVGACGSAGHVTAPESAQFDGGGTYGSGGNLIPAGSTGGIVVEAEDGGGTYGSGGRTSGTSGTDASSTTACDSDERGGGTYGSGGRVGECPVTEPTQ